MLTKNDSLIDQALSIWTSGGWLMLPLLVLTFFIYATALDLFCRVHFHFLVRSRVHKLGSGEIAGRLDKELSPLRCLVSFQARDSEEVKRHFTEVRNEYLPPIDRRIRFLAIIITTGPLLGLLGTVTGMLSTFNGMVEQLGSRFDGIVMGISEALITTQTGLVISVPAMVLLSLVIQRRNTLFHCIARLERFNTRLVIRSNGRMPKGTEVGDLNR
ncbi:MAG: MotA/TolQ/ExbB proton channel family protein [Verrucomicrobiota bacterium]